MDLGRQQANASRPLCWLPFLLRQVGFLHVWGHVSWLGDPERKLFPSSSNWEIQEKVLSGFL